MWERSGRRGQATARRRRPHAAARRRRDPHAAAAALHRQLFVVGLLEPSQERCVVGLLNPVNAAAKHLAKIGLSDPVSAATEDLAKINLSDPDAAATDPSQNSSKFGLPAPTTGDTPQAPIIDMDQARTYLNSACTLADLAVKHVDLAVTAISSCLDPAQVASISTFANTVAYTK